MTVLVRIQEALSARKRREDLPAIRELLALDGTSRLLDVGGSAGRVTSLLSSGAGRAVVLEPDGRKVAYGRSRRPRLEFVEGRAESIPFPEASFDRVSAIVSFHHTDDPGRALDEIRRVLVPGGRVVMHEMYPGQHAGILPRLVGRWLHGSSPHFLEPAHLARSLEEHGFRDVVVRDGARGYTLAATR